MRHAPCARARLLSALVIAFEGLTAAEPSRAQCLTVPEPGDVDWFGPVWIRDDAGALMPEVEVTTHPDLDTWLEVRLIGVGLDVGWTEGPLGASEGPFVVPVAVDPGLTAGVTGLVAVVVGVSATHPETGELAASAQAALGYAVFDGGVPRWFDDAGARAAMVAPVVPVDALAEATWDGDLVGREVR